MNRVCSPGLILQTDCSLGCTAVSENAPKQPQEPLPSSAWVTPEHCLQPCPPREAEKGPLHPSTAPAALPASPRSNCPFCTQMQQASHSSCTTAPAAPGQIRSLHKRQLLVLQLVLLCQGRPDKVVGSPSISDVLLPSAGYLCVESNDFSSLAPRLGLAPGTISAVYKSHTPASSS